MTNVSLCVIAYNEERFISECLGSAASSVDEIIVGVDSRTNDRTIQYIRNVYHARFFYFDWTGDFSEARNQVIQRANGEWVLALDADEMLTLAGQAAIARAITSAPDMDAFQLAMEHRTLKDEMITRDYHTRLFKSRLRYRFPVHEEVQSETLCQIQATEAHVIHYGYDKGLYAARSKLVRNLDLLMAWVEREPYHPQPNYYLAKIMFERGRPGAAATYAHIALNYGDDTPDKLSDNQKNWLTNALRDYAPA